MHQKNRIGIFLLKKCFGRLKRCTIMSNTRKVFEVREALKKVFASNRQSTSTNMHSGIQLGLFC